jgi:hypothetical protein
MVTPASLYRRMPATRRRTRRFLVIAALVGFPLQQIGYLLLVANGLLPTIVWGPVSIVLFSATIVGVVAIYGFGQGRMDRRERLDERQRQMVDRALITSYTVLTTVIVAVAGMLAVYLSFVGPLQLDMLGLTPWVIAIGLYVPFLPFAALAWIEPDAPADDEA